MTINFLNLYNDVASQPWSMFDSGAQQKADFEPALVSSINKAIVDIWYSYPFSFRLKKYELITLPKIYKYELPQGNILNLSDIEDNLFAVQIGNSYLEITEEFENESLSGQPDKFIIDDNKILLNPIPDNRYKIIIKYLTLSIGFNSSKQELFYLENPTDYIDIPQKYETAFKNAVLAKTLIESVVSINDENYLGYKLQFDKAYKLLIKISNPVKKSMSVKI